MPDAHNDKRKQHYRAIFPEDIQQNLQHRLRIITTDRGIEVLHGEKQAQEQEEAEDR